MLKPLVEIDPYHQALPSALEPTKCRPGFIPSDDFKQTLSSSSTPSRLDKTIASEYGAGDIHEQEKLQKAAPRDRLGKTLSAFIGSGTELASFASDKVSDTRRAIQTVHTDRGKQLVLQETINFTSTNNNNNTNTKTHYTTATYVDEPPSRAYFNNIINNGPNGSATVRPLRNTGRAGHLLWHHEVNNYGVQPNQHLNNTITSLYEHGLSNSTTRLVSPNTKQQQNNTNNSNTSLTQSLSSSIHSTSRPSTSLPSTTQLNLRQVPLNWYNASR